MAKATGTRARRPAPPPPPENPRRSRRWIGLGLAAALIAGTASMAYLTRGPSDVTVDEAVRDYRTQSRAESSAPAAAAVPASKANTAKAPAGSKARSAPVTERAAQQKAAPAPQTRFAPPRPGVYTFATQGSEETDALSGQRHTYPDETTMTVRRSDCGWVARWQPLKERWEENSLCERAAGTEMVRYVMYHEFFRRGQTEEFACPGGFVQKPNAKVGSSWTFTCKSHNTTGSSRVTVAGIEDVDVGGRRVRAVHMHYDIKASGANNGTITQDRWVSLGSPRIMVRMIQKANLRTQSPFGPVGYKESFRLDLKSLDPRT